jgi:hypothetical protein
MHVHYERFGRRLTLRSIIIVKDWLQYIFKF